MPIAWAGATPPLRRHDLAPVTVRVTDPDEFLTTIAPGTGVQIKLQDRGFGAHRTLRVGPAMWIARGRMDSPVAIRVGVPRRASFGVAELDALDGATTIPAPMRIDGQPHPPGTLRWTPAGGEIYSVDPGGAAWWTYSFPLDRAATAYEALFAAPFRPPDSVTRIAAIGAARSRALTLLLTRALFYADQIPGSLVDELLRLTLEPFVPSPHWTPPPSVARRRAVIDDLVALAEQSWGDPLPLAEVCARLAVPLRTLNACANAVLGISAAAFLRTQRMRAARLTLRAGLVRSVTEAATRHGFFELGRFSGEYRAAFGESPSATLHAARHRPAARR